MRFEVSHTTEYEYSRAVVLDPMTIRLRPREDIHQRLVRFDLSIEPEPAGRNDVVDAEGNAVTRVWFTGKANLFTLKSSFAVETVGPDPFGVVILDPAATRLPASYPEGELPSLARFRSATVDGAVSAFARDVAEEAGHDVFRFLLALADRMAGGFERVVRDEGEPWDAPRTLERRAGSCRDYATLFIAACRAQGLAARFVSGYQRGDDDADQERYLHAWAEVYVSEAGWLGYDPGSGLAVTDDHIPVAAAPEPLAAAPTSGAFWGTGVRSTLRTSLRIDATA